jgi:hypothetical protein
LFHLIVIYCFWVISPLSLAGRPANRSFKGGWPGAREGQIEDAFPYHLQGAIGTDKKKKLDY